MTGPVALSVLLVWHGNILVGTVELEPKDCVAQAQAATEHGFPSVCVQKSCTDLLATSMAGWRVECPAREEEPTGETNANRSAAASGSRN